MLVQQRGAVKSSWKRVSGGGEDGVIDTHVSWLIAQEKAAERIRDKARDPK